MTLKTLVTASDLERWADRIDARSRLPRVIRRLIEATAVTIDQIEFRADEATQLPGWDGTTSLPAGSAYGPTGKTGWELSTEKGIRGKAEDDYKKRTADPLGLIPTESTFVFVTPRVWAGKNDWIAERTKDRIWREVRAYDATDLSAWLERAPAVCVSLSVEVGKHPEGARDLETFWGDWSRMTNPPVSPAFLLAGRTESANNVLEWLQGREGVLAIRAGSRDEARAFFAAAVQELPEPARERVLARTLVAGELPTWSHLCESSDSLFLVPTFDPGDAVARALGAHHRIVVGLGPDDPPSTGIAVPPLDRDAAAKALIAGGVAEEDAHAHAKLARRSLTAFRRTQAVSPKFQRPEWSSGPTAHIAVAAMLAGGWVDDVDGDKEVLATLSQVPPEEFDRVTVTWVSTEDPPVRRTGGRWLLVSLEDAWALLSKYITRADVDRLRKLAVEVLTGVDPSFDLAPDRRWMAGALGKKPKHSPTLRQGIAETLAFLGAVGDTLSASAGITGSDVSKAVVREVVEKANGDWRIWASLSPLLGRLVEAAPDVLLEGLNEGLKGDRPVLELFTDSESPLMGSSPHVGLLWALETAAWSPELLGSVAVLLARLARLDPGGKTENRPLNSLRGVFCLWHPQTSAPLDKQFRVIDKLRELEPDVAWSLMRKLIPAFHDIGMNTARPRWRDWAPDETQPVTRRQLALSLVEISTRLRADVGTNPKRWDALLDALPTLPPDEVIHVVEQLDNLKLGDLQPGDRQSIRNEIRSLVSTHRSFESAGWALVPTVVNRLADIYTRSEPTDPLERFAWLFGRSPQLLEGRQHDWKKQEEELAKGRAEAVTSLNGSLGPSGFDALAQLVEDPFQLGLAIGRSDLLTESGEDALMGLYLGTEDSRRTAYARGFLVGRINERGRDWAAKKLKGFTGTEADAKRAEVLLCLPLDEQTWREVSAFGQGTERLYWRGVNPYPTPDSLLTHAVRHLLDHQRPYAAVALLGLHTRTPAKPPGSLVAEALEQMLTTRMEDDPPISTWEYYLPDLLDILSATPEIAEERVARLEWNLLPLLRERPPKTLHRHLSATPQFFMEVASLVYRAEDDEEREVTEEERSRARHGHTLLDSWRTIPGTREDGTIDLSRLKEWVHEARKEAAAANRADIGDILIGQMLSGTPRDSDGFWPHSAVRAVIEEVESPKLEEGLEVGVFNGRGVVTRALDEGGAQERSIAGSYRAAATAIDDRSPRTAAMLRRLADTYDAHGRFLDTDTEAFNDRG